MHYFAGIYLVIVNDKKSEESFEFSRKGNWNPGPVQRDQSVSNDENHYGLKYRVKPQSGIILALDLV